METNTNGTVLPVRDMTKHWWKEGVVYQIYPSSFKDSNGDGLGDIPGITSKLDYLKELGVDIIWISPFYQSPQYDMGYDISDYRAVHGPYGTVADMDELIQGCHQRGLRVLVDLVINHTSHLHRWFLESRSSKTNPKRDWYIWRPASYVNGERCPPNNWKAAFGGSVWEWDEHTQEYFLHYFAPEQPDVNWENPALRQALYDEAMRFWLDKGVDGFRIDTVNMYSKFLDFPNVAVTNNDSPWQEAGKYFFNGPRLHEFIKEMNREVLSKYDTMTVGECPGVSDTSEILEMVAASSKELNMAFSFDHVQIDIRPERYPPREWKLSQMKTILTRFQKLAEGNDGWTANYFENHDQARSVSRFASDEPEYRVASAKMLAILLLSLSGTAFIHQGQEIGMINAPHSWDIEDYKDVDTINLYNEVKRVSNGDPTKLKQVKDSIQLTARDHGRLPFQWDSSPQAGFTTGKPWMKVHDAYPEINAAQQMRDENSTLTFYRRLLRFRKENVHLFAYANFQLCDPENEQVMSFIKTFGQHHAFVTLNFSKSKQRVPKPIGIQGQLERVFGNFPNSSENTLEAYEGRIYFVT